jgi:hypothetical protein
MGALVNFGYTATLNRSVLGRPGYMLRCTRRCRAPIILLTSLIRINAGSFGGNWFVLAELAQHQKLDRAGTEEAGMRRET